MFYTHYSLPWNPSYLSSFTIVMLQCWLKKEVKVRSESQRRKPKVGHLCQCQCCWPRWFYSWQTSPRQLWLMGRISLLSSNSQMLKEREALWQLWSSKHSYWEGASVEEGPSRGILHKVFVSSWWNPVQCPSLFRIHIVLGVQTKPNHHLLKRNSVW